MMCNLAKFLQEQELTCLRMAKAANDGTPDQNEWLRTAEVLYERRKEHVPACKKCSSAPRAKQG